MRNAARTMRRVIATAVFALAMTAPALADPLRIVSEGICPAVAMHPVEVREQGDANVATTLYTPKTLR